MAAHSAPPDSYEWQQMADSGKSTGNLKPKQRQAIRALLVADSVPDAAKRAKVPQRTLYNWLDDPAFRTALNDAEGDMIDAATRRLIALQDGAIDTIKGLTADDDAPASVRLRAAVAVLDYLLRLRELRNIEKRLIALEAADLDGGNV